MVQRASEDARDVHWTRERERLATELRYVLRRREWSPTPEIIEAIVEWQIEAVAGARMDSWIPGMAGSRDSVVKDVLSRYYAHRMGVAVARLIDENSGLKQQLLHAAECIRYYALGTTDGGSRAKAALGPLLAPEPQDEEAGVIPNFLVAWSEEASQASQMAD
jgi:hypothetical protein